jgi:hypothetical protein
MKSEIVVPGDEEPTQAEPELADAVPGDDLPDDTEPDIEEEEEPA